MEIDTAKLQLSNVHALQRWRGGGFGDQVVSFARAKIRVSLYDCPRRYSNPKAEKSGALWDCPTTEASPTSIRSTMR